MPHSLAASVLDRIDHVLAGKPEKDDHALGEAGRGLAQIRDRMVQHGREHGYTEAEQTRLEHVNAVISVVLAMHFPMGEVPWEELAKGRDWLAALGDA